MNRIIEHTLRWIILLPASALSCWIVYFLFMASSSILIPDYGFLSSLRAPIRNVLEFIATGLMGIALAHAAYFVAPAHKKVAAYALSGLAGFLFSVSVGIGIVQEQFVTVAFALPALGGLAYGCYTLKDVS